MGISTFSQQTVNTGLAGPVGSGNFIINGAFDIAQRGNSINYVSPTIYTLDRFWANGFGTGQPFTVSRHTTNPPQNFRYFMRITQTSSNGTNLNIGQPLETDTVIGLRGATVTASFWAKVVTNFTNPWTFSAVSSNTLIDSSVAPGTSGVTTVSNSSLTIANVSSWVFYQKSFIVPSNATSFAIMFGSGNSVANGAVIEITGIQLELGSVATPFRRNAPSIQAELAACQRYYYRRTATVSQEMLITGYQPANTNIFSTWHHPQPLRATPSFSAFGGTWSPLNSPSDIVILASGQNAISAYITVNPSISNANQSSRISAVGAFYEVSAEL